MTVDAEIVKQDAERLEQTYSKALGDLDQTWRALYFEDHPKRRQQLERKAQTLTLAGALLAGRHELTCRALETLEGHD